MFKWVAKAKKIFTKDIFDDSLVRINDDGFFSDDISVSIEDIIREDEDDSLGKLHVLSLNEFREAMGEAWDSREAKILVLTESILRQRVGTGNRWEHKSNEIYIMLFPALSEIEGSARAYEIAEELGLKIIGERFDGSRRPMVRVAGVDPKEALNKDGSLNIEKLEDAGRKGEAVSSAKQKNKIENKDKNLHPIADSDWKKNQWEHDDHDTNWHKNQIDKNSKNTDWEQLKRDKKASNDPQWVTMQKDVNPPKSSTVSTEQHQNKGTYSLSYAPCWEHSKQALWMYRSLLCYQANHESQIEEGISAYYYHQSAIARLKLDIWLLKKTAQALSVFAQKNIQTPTFIPVHITSLTNEYLPDFLEAYEDIPSDIRQKFLILEIRGIEKMHLNQLLLVFEQLNQHSYALAVDITNHAQINAIFQDPQLLANVTWFGVDAQNFYGQDDILQTLLNDVMQQCALHSKKSYCFNLKRRITLRQLLSNNIDLVNGAALVKSGDKIRPPFNLAKDRLLKTQP